MDAPHVPQQAYWAALAAVGGAVRYLDVYLKGGAVPRFGLMIANAIVSGFTGFMTASIMLHVQPDWELVSAGVGGYMGTQAMDWLADAIRAKLGDDRRDSYDREREHHEDHH